MQLKLHRIARTSKHQRAGKLSSNRQEKKRLVNWSRVVLLPNSKRWERYSEPFFKGQMPRTRPHAVNAKTLRTMRAFNLTFTQHRRMKKGIRRRIHGQIHKAKIAADRRAAASHLIPVLKRGLARKSVAIWITSRSRMSSKTSWETCIEKMSQPSRCSKTMPKRLAA